MLSRAMRQYNRANAASHRSSSLREKEDATLSVDGLALTPEQSSQEWRGVDNNEDVTTLSASLLAL